MSITLTYLDDLSRIRVELASLSEDTVVVQRSSNDALWETVRGGTALPVSSGAATVDDYEFYPGQTFYRVLDAEDPGAGAVESDDITVNLDRVWLKSIRHPFLNRPVTVTDWSDITRQGRGGLFEATGRSVPVAVTDVRGSRGFTVTLLTDTLTEARDMDLALAAGRVMFVHVPDDCPIPGGYVAISGTGEERRSTRGAKRYWPLECRIVAEPAPQVVPTTLTWRTVRRLYGGWQAVRQSNPTWGPLLDLVADLDDAVVI